MFLKYGFAYSLYAYHSLPHPPPNQIASITWSSFYFLRVLETTPSYLAQDYLLSYLREKERKEL